MSEPPHGLPPTHQQPPGGDGRRAVVVIAAFLVALALLAVAVIVPRLIDRDDEEPAASEDPADTSLSEVQVIEIPRRNHELGEIDYPQTPPAGGPHNPQWLDCGIYDEPISNENAVHDLEHGTVWITYDPSLSEDDVEALAVQLPDNGILSPYDDLPSPVVVTVWGTQLQLSGPQDAGLRLFIEKYQGGITAPEPFASCQGGLTDPEGTLT